MKGIKIRHKQKVTYRDILLAQDETEEMELLRKYVTKDPTDIAAYVRLGDILRKKGMCNDAMKIHRSLLKPNMEKNIKARILVSTINDLICAKRFKETLVYLKEITILFPKEDKYREILAGIYEHLGQWEDAIEVRRKMRDKKTLAFLYALYGKKLLEKGEKRRAVQNINTALKMDPSSIPGLLFMGDIKYNEGDTDSAMELWRRIINNFPEFAFLAFDRLENACFEKKIYIDMIEIYESCLKTPKNIEAYIRLAKLYSKLGENRKALELLLQAYESAENTELALQIADFHKKEGNYKEAFESIRPLVDSQRKYRCSRCNYVYDDFHFRCEECFEWMSIKRI